MTREHEAVRDLLAPVALGATGAGETARVERHAGECAVCREEMASLREGAAALALSVPSIAPPPRLKHDLMATVRREAAAARPVARTATRPARRRLPRLRSWPALAGAAAACALVIAGLNVAVLLQDDEPRAAGEVVAVNAGGAGGLDARVVYLPNEDQAIVTLEGVRPPGQGSGYELWVVEDGGQRSAGFLQQQGPAEVSLVASRLRGAEALAVTLEPLGNRTAPSTEPLVLIPIPA